MTFGTSDKEAPEEQVEGPLLPLRALIVTSLVPSAECNQGASAPEQPIRLDLSDPEQIFQKLRPRLVIEVPSVLAEGQMTKVEFAPTSLKSFRPDGMIAEVKLLRALVDGRAVLERVRQGELTPTQAEGQLSRLWEGSPFAREVLGLSAGTAPAAKPFEAPAPAAKPDAAEAKATSILDMVDMGDDSSSSDSPAPAAAPSEPSESSSKMSKIIAQVALSGRRGGASRPSDAVPRVDQALGAQIGAILQHPEVRRLERAYRGLRFLADRAQRVPGLIIDVLAIPEEGAAPAFVRAVSKKTDVPFSFAVVDVEIDGSARSFTELGAIAEAAENNVVPALVNGTEKLVGVGDLASIERIDNKQGLFTAAHRAPWRAAVTKTPMRWVSIAMNGVLLRQPYDKNSSRVREAAIVETPNDHEGVVWLSPSWVVAALILKSFKETDWPGRIVGTRNGLLENLQVREIEDDGQTIAVPTQAYLTTDSQKEMSRIGLLVIASAPNSDAAYLHTAPMAYVQPDKKTYDSATTEPENRPPAISLVDTLFISRLVQFTRSLAEKLPPDSNPSEVQEILEGAMGLLFEKAAPPGPGISLKVKSTADGAVVAINIEPRRFLGVSLEEFGFEMPIG